MARLMSRTRLLILSDTHGAQPRTGDGVAYQAENGLPDIYLLDGFRSPLPSADVAIHCGDLTLGSTPVEYKATFEMLRKIDAPLKLAIAGNHDRCLDTAHWDKSAMWAGELHRESRARYPAMARETIREARADNVHLLTEGTYDFVLRNGARLKVFASPMTPAYGSWGFQYQGAHPWSIPRGVDLVMTHGPPKGIQDKTPFGIKAGCRHLLEAIHHARPRIHCFGHIHEAWGARLVTWNDPPPSEDPRPVLFDADSSLVLEDLSTLEPQWEDDRDGMIAKAWRFNNKARQGGCAVSICSGSDIPFEHGKQTLFVNAAIMSLRYKPVQLPWLVDLDLPQATDDDIELSQRTKARITQDYPTAGENIGAQDAKF